MNIDPSCASHFYVVLTTIHVFSAFISIHYSKVPLAHFSCQKSDKKENMQQQWIEEGCEISVLVQFELCFIISVIIVLQFKLQRKPFITKCTFASL
jgi:hypothetical protein